LGLAALTAAGLLGGAHQAGVVDVFPDEVKCAHDNNTVGDVRLNLNVKGVYPSCFTLFLLSILLLLYLFNLSSHFFIAS
jgi:hypothetical protein